MKINWGTGIAIFYTCFMAAMIIMVIKSTQNNVQLVQENYYDKDLNYEEFRLKRENASNLSVPIEIKYLTSTKNIQVIFPDNTEDISGQISLFRPSNKFLDKQFKISVNASGKMEIPVDKSFQNGLWKVQVEWLNQGKSYFSEQSIVI